MSANKAEEEHPSRRNSEDVDSPRKRMRLDHSMRKSWSLIDRRTDHEVLQEMGVSILDPDEDISNESNNMLHHKPVKRKHNIENVNPNVNASPRKSSPKKQNAGRGRSPKSADKVKPLSETQLDSSISSDYLIDEETPLAQVNANLHYNAGNKRNLTPPPCVEETPSTVWSASEPDSFLTLSDEVMLSVFRWLPKRTLAHCMMVCKRWYQVACDETLWQRLDLGNKTLARNSLGKILDRKPLIVRLASSEIGEWRPKAAPAPSRIQLLDLSMATVDQTTLNILIKACPMLKKLSLESVLVDDNTCDIIGQCSSLETLNLTMAQGITAEGLEFILKGCTNIQSLNISWCNLTEDALNILVDMLPQKLLRLNIAGARLLTDDMCVRLSNRCSRLQELDVSDCGRLSARSAAALARLTHLHHLALSRCYLVPSATLAKLNGMVSLQYLDVFGMLQQSSLTALRAALPAIQINQFMFSAIARPTVGTRRTSVWGFRTRD